MAKWKKVVSALLVTYLLIWFTDSIWEYIPESKPGPTNPVNKNCEGYVDEVGEYNEPCIPAQQEDPGWQGR